MFPLSVAAMQAYIVGSPPVILGSRKRIVKTAALPRG